MSNSYKTVLLCCMSWLGNDLLRAQVVTNYGFYRYNWQFVNPATLNYSYFHRPQTIESKESNKAKERLFNATSTYRSQAQGLEQPRTAMSFHCEYILNLREANHFSRSSSKSGQLKIGAGIIKDTWDVSQLTTAYLGIAGKIRLDPNIQLLAGINFAQTSQQLDKSLFKPQDPKDPLLPLLWEPRKYTILIPGILVTDFKSFYAGWSWYYAFDEPLSRQHQLLMGYNFTKPRFHNRSGGIDVENILYHSGFSAWIRYDPKNRLQNALGDLSPVSAAFNWRAQLPISFGYQRLWAGLGWNTAKQGRIEVGYSYFTPAVMGELESVDWHVGIGFDFPLGIVQSKLGSNLEINLGISL